MTGKEVREKHMKQKTMSRSKIVQCDFGKKDARMNEKISENRKRGVLLLLLVVLFWFVLLAVVPAMAAEKTCLVSVPVSVQLTGTAVGGQTENTPVFTVVMEAQNERNELPLPEQNQIQMGADGSGTFDAILYTTPGDYQYHIRQLAGTDQNIEYDVTEYDVTVRVLNVEGGGLEAEVWALKSGQPDKQSRIVFHNKWKTETTPGTVTEPAQTGVKTTTMMRTPKTDDIQRPAVYVVMIIAVAGTAIGVSLYRKYRKKEEL